MATATVHIDMACLSMQAQAITTGSSTSGCTMLSVKVDPVVANANSEGDVRGTMQLEVGFLTSWLLRKRLLGCKFLVYFSCDTYLCGAGCSV